MSKVAIQGNASGTGTFTIAAPNSNTDRTLTLPDEAGTVLTSGSALSSFPSGFANGITMADHWYLTSNFGISTTVAEVNVNWSRATSSDAGIIGSAMTRSGGVFTFPETGMYLIHFQARFLSDNGNDLYAYAALQTTTDNSTYSNRITPIDSFYAQNSYGSSAGTIVFDVANTSTHKVKIIAQTNSINCNLVGSQERITAITFLKIGDT